MSRLAACFLFSLLVDDSKSLTGVYFPSRRPEKMAKLPVILGNLDVTIDSVAPDLTSKPTKLTSTQPVWEMKASAAQTRRTKLSAGGSLGLPVSCLCV